MANMRNLPSSIRYPDNRQSPRDERLPLPGATVAREYKGQSVEVKVLRGGFLYAGDVYRSLSAVARAVTGTHWNGYHFFRL